MNPFALSPPPLMQHKTRWEWRFGLFGWLLVPVVVWSLAQ